MTANDPMVSLPRTTHRYPDDDVRFKLARLVFDHRLKPILAIPVFGTAAIFGGDAGVRVGCGILGTVLVAGVIAGGKKEILAFSRVAAEIAGFVGTLWGTEHLATSFAGMEPKAGWILGGVAYFVGRICGGVIESEMKY